MSFMNKGVTSGSNAMNSKVKAVCLLDIQHLAVDCKSFILRTYDLSPTINQTSDSAKFRQASEVPPTASLA